MFRNKQYATLAAIAALTATKHEAGAVRVKSDSQWHLAMVPDGLDRNSFMSAPVSFGFAPSPIFGGGFGGLEDFQSMPVVGGSLKDMMHQAEERGAAQGGQSYSSSSSSSYSSSIGEDGKRHEKSSKAGQQKVCKDGQCKVVRCENGLCREVIEPMGSD